MLVEHSIYTSFQDPEYCRVLWHPQGNISSNWSGTVSVLVTDQQHNSITISWTLGTDDTSTHFVFVSTTGSGSTCTYSAPCTFATAFGSTFAATSFPGAICYVFGGSYTGATNLPVYTDTDTSSNGFEAYVGRKPNALIGIPGASVTLDAAQGNLSTLPHLIQLGAHAADWYMENITANAYNTGAVDELITLGGSGSNRLTFDQLCWTNAGYGTGTSGNMSMLYSNGIQNPRSYLFVTDSCETNRQSIAVGNNYGFADIYSFSYVLIQRSVENSPSANLDAAFYFKSDVENSEMRENSANVAGAAHAFDYGQNQWSGSGNDESEYNIGININQFQFNFAGSQYTWLNMAAFRNTIISGGIGLKVGLPNVNLGGPWITSVTSASGGSLTPADVYYLGMTSVATNESEMLSGTFGNASSGTGAGDSNINSLTLAAGDGSAVVSFDTEPGAVTVNLYGGLAQSVSSISCAGTTITVNTTSPHGLSTGAVVHQAGFSPNGYNGTPSITVTGSSSYTYTVGSCPGAETALGVYAPMQLIASGLSPSSGSYTWNGSAPTATYPPITPTAYSTYRDIFYANAVSSTTLSAPGPIGNIITNGTLGLANLIDTSGAGTEVCTSVTTGCAAVGVLNTTQAGYSSLIGTAGYQIQ
jgi:hypothetical protein